MKFLMDSHGNIYASLVKEKEKQWKISPQGKYSHLTSPESIRLGDYQKSA